MKSQYHRARRQSTVSRIQSCCVLCGCRSSSLSNFYNITDHHTALTQRKHSLSFHIIIRKSNLYTTQNGRVPRREPRSVLYILYSHATLRERNTIDNNSSREFSTRPSHDDCFTDRGARAVIGFRRLFKRAFLCPRLGDESCGFRCFIEYGSKKKNFFFQFFFQITEF